jgi:acyl-CoA thioester hydrolase
MLPLSRAIEIASIKGERIRILHSSPRRKRGLTLQDPTPKPTRPAPPAIEQFPRRGTDTVRFADCDPQGHVNHAKFATYMETSRAAIIRDPAHPLLVEGATSVLARLEIDYLRELHFPGTVQIGSAIVEIGRSSYIFSHALYREDGECVATGRITMVLIDREARRARPLPPELVERLKQLTLGKA